MTSDHDSTWCLDSSVVAEMDLYCRYLTGNLADALSQALFPRGVDRGLVQLGSGEEKVRQFILRNPWSVGSIDAALGLFVPKHGLRRRMILAFAILEANPYFFEAFRPKSYSHAHVLTLACRGMAELFKSVIGRIILWLV